MYFSFVVRFSSSSSNVLSSITSVSRTVKINFTIIVIIVITFGNNVRLNAKTNDSQAMSADFNVSLFFVGRVRFYIIVCFEFELSPHFVRKTSLRLIRSITLTECGSALQTFIPSFEKFLLDSETSDYLQTSQLDCRKRKKENVSFRLSDDVSHRLWVTFLSQKQKGARIFNYLCMPNLGRRAEFWDDEEMCEFFMTMACVYHNLAKWEKHFRCDEHT